MKNYLLHKTICADIVYFAGNTYELKDDSKILKEFKLGEDLSLIDVDANKNKEAIKKATR